MYKNILWDIDNTLLDFTASEKYAFDTAMSDAGLVPSEELLQIYSRTNIMYWKMLERGEIQKDALLVKRFVTFFEKAGIDHVDIPAFQKNYQRLLGSVYYYLDDSFSLCEKLHKKFRQYIVTNGVSSTQRSKLVLSRFDQIMEDIFISEELGAEKPSLRFFEQCFSRIPGFKKEETIIIGDSLTSDMQGGNNAGITCCLYNPKGLPVKTDLCIPYIIQNLWDILPILNGP